MVKQNINLAELEALANAATEGPWHCMDTGFTRHHQGAPTVYATDDELRYIAKCQDMPVHYEHQPTNDLANARFIAAARQAVPELITRIRELETQLEQHNTGA